MVAMIIIIIIIIIITGNTIENMHFWRGEKSKFEMAQIDGKHDDEVGDIIYVMSFAFFVVQYYVGGNM